VRARGAAVVLALGVGLAARAAAASAPPIAIIVGNDIGAPGEPVLRYAESDATRIADVLETLGTFTPARTRLLRGRAAVEVRRAISDAEAELAREGADGLLLIYYSGHADAEALHLAGTTLALRELSAFVSQPTVGTRVMIVDACRSGMLTQTKGGRPAGDFDVRLATPDNPHGLAIITSSASGEDAQESDELGASFFTHHFAAGLIGAADRDDDGAVTLAEAFAYAANHTVASTAVTRVGPQHPTFKLDMGGRGDLVLTRPRGAARVGQLGFGDRGWYLVRRHADAMVVAELTSDGDARALSVAPGRYDVTRRDDDRVSSGTIDVAAGSGVVVTESRLRPVELGRVVRKGGTTRTRATAVLAAAGLRGPVLDLGPGLGGGVGVRVDLRALSLTGALEFLGASRQSDRATRLDTTEFGLRLGALRAFDLLSRASFALGAEAGVARFTQSATDQAPSSGWRASYALSLGPALVAEVPLPRRLFVWLEAAAPFYLMSVEAPAHDASSRQWTATYRATAAVGAYL
jgi:Caspase domain